MTRRHVPFDCAGSICIGTLDSRPAESETHSGCGTIGLLIVTGGNEIRSGAWNGQAQLAAAVAASGHPVFRFDRRGVGDSEGHNSGFRGAAPDIQAALAAFRHAVPGLQRVIALGNCDAASALMLSGGAGCDGLVLANPWTFATAEETVAAPEAVRAHYARRLRDPAALWRVLSGRTPLRRVMISIRDIARPAVPSSLVAELQAGLEAFTGPVRILLADHDRTAEVFRARWPHHDPRLRLCAGASHSFVEPAAQAWLLNQVLEALAPPAGPDRG